MRFEVAPWPARLSVVSAIATAVLLGVVCALYLGIPRGTQVPFAETFATLLVAIPLVILFTAILFVVSGYDLDPEELRVRRLLWSTHIALDGLDGAWHDSSAMCRSLRVFGNGGLFSVTGVFQNAALGRDRAFVTDPRNAIVLHFPSRVVVVSPARPDAFLGRLESLFPSVRIGRGKSG